jgi:photosystem II stability/assembly factor-like uncharacterized protein
MKKSVLLLSICFILISSISFSQTGWFSQQSGTTNNLYDVYFVNAQTGWVVGDSAILKSTNEGLNWIRQDFYYLGMKCVFNSVKFLNENTGFVAGGHHSGYYDFYYEYIFKTINGGLNWSILYNIQGGGNAVITKIFPVDETNIYITTSGSAYNAASGGVAKSTDGGSSFQFGASYGESNAIYCLNANIAWASSYFWTDVPEEKGYILKTTNGGLNWIQQYKDSLNNATNIYSIKFFDQNTGYAIGRVHYSSRFFKTTNGGSNWDTTYLNNGKYECMQFIDINTGWVGGEVDIDTTSISFTSNGGINWISQNKNYSTFINNMSFINSLTGWAVGNNGNILKTTTGGISFPIDTLTPQYFPLAVGNIFIYNDEEVMPPSESKFKIYIEKDSIANGHLYYKLMRSAIGYNDYSTGWYRYDSASGKILVYSPGNGCEPFANDKVIDSLTSKMGDHCDGCTYMGISLRSCIDTANGTYFNQTVKTKSFHHDGIVFENLIYAKGFGKVYYYGGEPNTNYYTTMKGCKINGIVYGDTSFYPVNNYTVSGTIKYFDNNQPVTSGTVKAFKLDKNTGNILYLDSAQIQLDGTYTLPNVPQDSVDIGVFPNSTQTNDYVITYYPSTVYWQNAITLYPIYSLSNIDISAIRMTGATANNSVNGKVMLSTDANTGNIKDAFLYVKDGNTFVRCATSDINGIYHLQSLPSGNLKIIVNRLGFTNDSTNITITSTDNIDSINFSLHRVYTGIKQVSINVPTEFKLFQNYPNPFNPTTTIRFQIPGYNMSSPHALGGYPVSLKVYNILGKEIATLVNETLQPGIYEIQFPNNQYTNNRLPSGIYFYRLTTDKFTDVKRMILLK